MRNSEKQGLVQVYTGSGKGKTTAAWGQALRAVGHGWKVAIVQFLKPPTSGERVASECLKPDMTVFGKTSPYNPNINQHASEKLKEESSTNFKIAVEKILSGDWDMIVLDEINMALYYGFVGRDEVLELLRERSPHTELVFTGRYAPDWLIDAADLVTEMVEVKHPAKNGIKAREGTEY